MAKCATCGAELIGSAKFCATCGAPSPKVDEFATTSPSSGLAGPEVDAARARMASSRPPPSNVNPFGATASPATGGAKDRPTRPPPSERAEPSQISPLASSNATEGGAFKEAVEAALEKARALAAETPNAKKPGTQLMPGAPSRGAPPAEAKKAVVRTVAMNFNPKASGPQSVGAPDTRAPDTRVGFGPSSVAPNTNPASGAFQNPNSARSNPQSYGQPPAVAAPYSNPYTQRGYPAPPAYPYAFGYAPGMRVFVTWSNGQRYPASVSQLSGSKCLVVFPDGQQHWVDVQYLTPGG